jgi:hypothetical protein
VHAQGSHHLAHVLTACGNLPGRAYTEISVSQLAAYSSLLMGSIFITVKPFIQLIHVCKSSANKSQKHFIQLWLSRDKPNPQMS